MSADPYITLAILALIFARLIKSKIPPVAISAGVITFLQAPLISPF